MYVHGGYDRGWWRVPHRIAGFLGAEQTVAVGNTTNLGVLAFSVGLTALAVMLYLGDAWRLVGL